MAGDEGAVDGLVVLVVDDHPVFRAGLVALLSGDPRIDRIVEAATVADALATAQREAPGLALVDLG